MNLPAGLLAGLSERLQEQTPVLVVDEYRLPTVPAIHQVVNRSLILDSQLAWHGPPRSQNPENTSIVISDPFSTPFLNIKDINEGTTLSIPSGFPSIKPKWLQNLIKPRSNRLGIHGS